MIFLISILLTILPLLGVLWIVVFSSVTTVDGLFMSLILLAISGVVGGNVLYELRKRKSGSGVTRSVRSSANGELVQRGKVERVEFFESNVGQPSKSIVTFAGESGVGPMLVFEGDVRNALPTGHKVEVIFRKASGYNVLVHVGQS